MDSAALDEGSVPTGVPAESLDALCLLFHLGLGSLHLLRLLLQLLLPLLQLSLGLVHRQQQLLLLLKKQPHQDLQVRVRSRPPAVATEQEVSLVFFFLTFFSLLVVLSSFSMFSSIFRHFFFSCSSRLRLYSSCVFRRPQ